MEKDLIPIIRTMVTPSRRLLSRRYPDGAIKSSVDRGAEMFKSLSEFCDTISDPIIIYTGPFESPSLDIQPPWQSSGSSFV